MTAKHPRMPWTQARPLRHLYCRLLGHAPLRLRCHELTTGGVVYEIPAFTECPRCLAWRSEPTTAASWAPLGDLFDHEAAPFRPEVP